MMLRHFKRKDKSLLAKLTANRMQRRFSIYISPLAELHPSVDFRHPTGIVIGEGVRIGKGSVIYQNVTLGGARSGDAERSAYPIVGENTTIFAGAVLVGKIRIGNDCIIGANAVVTSDVPDGSTAVGVPARIISRKQTD